MLTAPQQEAISSQSNKSLYLCRIRQQLPTPLPSKSPNPSHPHEVHRCQAVHFPASLLLNWGHGLPGNPTLDLLQSVPAPASRDSTGRIMQLFGANPRTLLALFSAKATVASQADRGPLTRHPLASPLLLVPSRTLPGSTGRLLPWGRTLSPRHPLPLGEVPPECAWPTASFR